MRFLHALPVAVVACGVLLAAGVRGQTETAGASALTVSEMAVGTGYDRGQRQLEGEAATFPSGTEKIYCFTRITGAEQPTEVAHVWLHKDNELARVTLAVGSVNWRTVSSKTVLPNWTGKWEVQVLDAEGNLLKSQAFTVE